MKGYPITIPNHTEITKKRIFHRWEKIGNPLAQKSSLKEEIPEIYQFLLVKFHLGAKSHFDPFSLWQDHQIPICDGFTSVFLASS